MERRDILAGGALTLGVFIVGAALFSPANDEERIAAVLDDLADTVSFSSPIASPVFHGSKLSGRFKDIFTDSMELHIDEISSQIPKSRGQLGIAAAQIMSRFGSFHAEFSDLNIQVEGGAAAVQGTLIVESKNSGQLQRGERKVALKFAKNDGNWLIQELRVKYAED